MRWLEQLRRRTAEDQRDTNRRTVQDERDQSRRTDADQRLTTARRQLTDLELRLQRIRRSIE